MIDFVFLLFFVLIAIFLLVLSTSKKNYQQIVESNGEKFAIRIKKGLRICGALLLICSLVWTIVAFI